MSIKGCREEVWDSQANPKEKVRLLIQTIQPPAQHSSNSCEDWWEWGYIISGAQFQTGWLHVEAVLTRRVYSNACMVVVSNNSKISHVLKSGEEIGTIRKVSIVNSLDINVKSHLQMVSFTELGCADGNPTNPVPV